MRRRRFLQATMAGAALVGLNPTRSGAFLARDVTHADCQIVVVESGYAAQLHAALANEPEAHPTVLVTNRWQVADTPRPALPDAAGWRSLEDALDAVPDDDPAVPVFHRSDGRVGIDYGVYGVPETYLIDGAGVIRFKHIGALTPDTVSGKILPLVKAMP